MSRGKKQAFFLLNREEEGTLVLKGERNLSELCAELFCAAEAERSERDGVTTERVRLAGAAAREVRRAEGSYLTLCAPDFASDRRTAGAVLRLLKEELLALLPGEGAILVAGLGNRAAAADALGPRARLCETGVPGRSGIESFDFVAALCGGLRPAGVIAVDSLSARDEGRLCTSFQVSDAGITPGSAGGGGRELSARTLGVPVISLGLSTVLALFDPPRLFAPAEVAAYVDVAAGVIAGAISAALLS